MRPLRIEVWCTLAAFSIHNKLNVLVNSGSISAFRLLNSVMFNVCHGTVCSLRFPLTIIAAGFFWENEAGVLLQLSWQRDGIIWEDKIFRTQWFTVAGTDLKRGSTPSCLSCSWRTCSCTCPACCTRPGSPRCRQRWRGRCRWRGGSCPACRCTRSWLALRGGRDC